MAAFRFGKTSRLSFSEPLSIDGIEFWDRVEFPTLIDQPDDFFYDVQEPDTIEILAHRFYGDVRLWWVIAIANDMELPPFGMNAGTTIQIPSTRFVLGELFLQSKRRGNTRRF